MKELKRSAAIIRPKRHFVKWANANSLDDREFSFEYFIEHYSLIILTPYYNLLERGRTANRYINWHCEDIFRDQLRGWNKDEETWPKKINSKTFKQWFTVEFVYDVAE